MGISFQPDKSFLSTWPTCIAVIYSIDDVSSFTTATKILRTIKKSSEETDRTPAVTLIGNVCIMLAEFLPSNMCC